MFELDGRIASHRVLPPRRVESNLRGDRKREELSTAASHSESNAQTREEVTRWNAIQAVECETTEMRLDHR